MSITSLRVFCCSLRLTRSLLPALLLFASPLVEARTKWLDVDPADLAATASKSAQGADTEIIFSRHVMDNSDRRTWTENHIQAKIFTQKGVEQAAILSITFNKDYKVSNIAARVVKPNGSFTELGSSDFHQTSIYKRGGVELKRTSFSFPNLQPGDVVEYKWDEEIVDEYFSRYNFICQAEVPTREYTIDVQGSRNDFDLMWFNCPNAERQPKGKKIVIRNLPPFVEEPMMPPENEFRGWMTMIFSHPYMRFYKNDSAWQMLGENLAEDYRLTITPNKTVQAKAKELTAGATEPNEQLARLYAFAQTMKNFSWADADSVVAQKKKRDAEDDYQTSAVTMDRGGGYPGDIDRLFAGLARASGFEVRRAISADRETKLSIKTPRGWIFTDRNSVAVKVGDQWRFYTPGHPLVPAGLNSEKDAGATAYICDEKKSFYSAIPFPRAEQTQTRRTGKFALDEEGNLDGTVELQLGGLAAVRLRDRWWNQSNDEITKNLREAMAERLPTAELSEVKLENRSDTSRPLQVNYTVRVPGYATSIGTRLAFAPNFFEVNTKETFTAEHRQFPIFFDFAKQEHDDIKITLPEGFTLDGASAPAPVGTPDEANHVSYTIKYSGKTRLLSYERHHVLANDGIVQFQAESYDVLKHLLGRIHRSDTHQLVIKPKTSPAVTSPAISQPAPTAL